jgi:hypothetical protein
MVAGYDHHRPGQSFKEGAGGGELPMARSLRQIAGDDSEVRFRLRNVGQ